MLNLLLSLSLLLTAHSEQGAKAPKWTNYWTAGQQSCRYNCGYHMGGCSCESYCWNYGNCCHDYNRYCPSTTYEPQRSCRYNCGNHMGSCSCDSSCRYYGNCCHDYNRYCPSTTTTPPTTSGQPSCRYNCGNHMGSCSCSSSCRYYGNCCHDYNSYCPSTTSGQRSCRYNCGNHMGSCSCDSSCRYYGNCCHDYNNYCPSTTYEPRPTSGQRSCRYNCGNHMGSCSCSSSCRYYGNCCHDYNRYCPSTTTTPPTTSGQPSCRYNCGNHMGSCSCSSSCRYYGNCCHDYNSYCPSTTSGQRSCRYNCGNHMGSCSCDSSCRYYGNCCHDYNNYCPSTTYEPRPTSGQRSCRYNCGNHMGSCSCSSSCRYYGNCCHDYNRYCPSTTTTPLTTSGQRSCRYNCGNHMGSCSCSSSCRYYGNCCHDYNRYCYTPTQDPWWTTPAKTCGGSLYGGGTFTSPNHPNHYSDRTRCEWQIRAQSDHRVFLRFTYVELENCCNCDYISVYDGPSTGYPYLGKICNSTLRSFYSSGNVMTVVFKTDSSVVARGFKAEYHNSLSPNSGSISCSDSKMTVTLRKSYLQSVGYEAENLFLNDETCRPRETYYDVIFSFPIDTCGNVQKFVNGTALYTNVLRGFPNPGGEITRQDFFRLNLTCLMNQESFSQILYVVKHNGNSSIIGSGMFKTSMDFYTSSSFYYKVNQWPYEVSLRQYLYVQINMDHQLNNSLHVYIDTCVASPSRTDFQNRAYYLIRDGCTRDSTYYSYVSGTQPYARFRFQAFQFLRATDTVYLQCKVFVCQAPYWNSACRRTCNGRRKRELTSNHEIRTLTLGPIQLKAGEDTKEEGSEKKEP